MQAIVWSQDEGADIDVSALLLPEPGLASDTALALREPDLAINAPAVHSQPEVAESLDATHEQSGTLGAADADEPDEGFGDQLAEAVKVILGPPLNAHGVSLIEGCMNDSATLLL